MPLVTVVSRSDDLVHPSIGVQVAQVEVLAFLQLVVLLPVVLVVEGQRLGVCSLLQTCDHFGQQCRTVELVEVEELSPSLDGALECDTMVGRQWLLVDSSQRQRKPIVKTPVVHVQMHPLMVSLRVLQQVVQPLVVLLRVLQQAVLPLVVLLQVGF